MQPPVPQLPALPIVPLAYVIFAIAIGVMLIGIIGQIVLIIVIVRDGGLRAMFNYLFRPIEFRERQREKIRAGFRRGRRPRASDTQGLWRKRDGEWQHVEWEGGDQQDIDHP